MIKFLEVSTSDVMALIREADREKAFLPSVSEPEFSVERFLSQENFPGYRLFGLNDDTGEFVSFISIKPIDDVTITIGPMYVGKTHRGKGLGKTQVAKLIEWAQINNVQGIVTKTWGLNAGSRKIFDGLGFKLTEEKLDARINGDSTVKYYLDLYMGVEAKNK